MEWTAALARAVGCGVAQVILALGKGFHGGGRLQPRRWGPKWRPGRTATAGRRDLCEVLRRAPEPRLPAAHKQQERCLEMRRDMGNGVESSKGWEVDGVDRKQGKSAAEMGVSGERLGRPGGVVLVGE